MSDEKTQEELEREKLNQAASDEAATVLDSVNDFLKRAEAVPGIDKKAIETCRNLIQTAFTNALKAVRAAEVPEVDEAE